MSCSSPFSHVQRFAQKLSPSCTDRRTSVYSEPNPLSALSHTSHHILRRFDCRSFTEDSDNSSQTSSQASSHDGTDGADSSPPTSVSSDGESSCEQRIPVASQTSLTATHTEAFVTGAFSSSQNPADTAHGQEAHVVPFRPRLSSSVQQESQQFRVNQSRSGRSSTTQSGSTTPQPCGSTTSSSTSERLQSRRRGCPASGLTVPPKLRRDTESTEAIVKMIVVFCTNLINSIWCPRALEPSSNSSTNSSGVLPLQLFIQETLRRSKTSYSTLQVALYYLILLKQCFAASNNTQESGQPSCRAMQCGRRMFLTALILASKYLQDRNYSARAWSKISGLPLQEINENERRYLTVIRWDLHMPKDTFENWSKIVLAICRFSSEGDVPGRHLDHQPPAPGTGPLCMKQSQQSVMCFGNAASKSWWSTHLNGLHTSMVKCGRQTEGFLLSLSPFRPTSIVSSPIFFDPLPRVASPDDTADNEAETTPKCLPKLPSIERLSQNYQTYDRSTSPSTSYKMPPQPLLRNLPTPQTTPRAEATNLWTSSFCRPGLRCRASASALGYVDKSALPAANLESCPPPRPKAADTFKSASETTWTDSFHHWQSSKASTPSLSSSPESTISDFSSVAPRSRSSSISSTSSWIPSIVNTPMADPESRFRRDVHSLQQKMVAERVLFQSKRSSLGECRPSIPRCQTAFKPAAQEDEGCFITDFSRPSKLRHSQSMRFHDEGYGSDDYGLPEYESRRKREAAEALLAFQSKQLSQQALADAMLSSSESRLSTQRPSQQLKRCRSDTSELVQLDTRLALLNKQEHCKVIDDSWLSSFAQSEHENQQRQMRIQLPCQSWATPRKPVLCGSQNKRMAVQPSEPASNVASDYLRRDILVG